MLSYTRHARERMRERRISEAEVKYVIHNYDVSFPGHGENTIISYVATTPSGRKIRVVIKETEETRLIISVMD